MRSHPYAAPSNTNKAKPFKHTLNFDFKITYSLVLSRNFFCSNDLTDGFVLEVIGIEGTAWLDVEVARDGISEGQREGGRVDPFYGRLPTDPSIVIPCL